VGNQPTIVTKLINKLRTVNQDLDQDKTGKILVLRSILILILDLKDLLKMIPCQPQPSQNRKRMKKVLESTSQLLSQAKRTRIPTSSSLRFKHSCLEKIQLLWTLRRFSWKTMNPQKQVKRSAESSSHMQQIPIKESSETIMKIEFPSF